MKTEEIIELAKKSRLGDCLWLSVSKIQQNAVEHFAALHREALIASGELVPREQVEAETARLDWLAEHGCAVRRVNNGRSNLISWLGKDRLRKAIDRARSQP